MRGKQRERQTGKQRWRQTNRGWAERAWEWDSVVLVLVRFWLPAGLYLSALIASSAYLSACSKSFSCKTAKQTTVYNLYQSKNWSFLHIFKIFFLDSISLKQHHSKILNVKSYWMDEYWAILIIKPVYNIMKSTSTIQCKKKKDINYV